MAPNTVKGLPTMAPQATPKGMSSRLMTMKFMQRAVASETSSPASITSPASDIEGSAKSSGKRRKTADTPNDSPAGKPLYDEKAFKAALEEEDKKRQAAIEKRAAELGDEHWVLPEARLPKSDAKQRVTLNFVQVGFAQIDGGRAEDADNDDEEIPGRSEYGKPRRLQFNMNKPTADEDASSESDSDHGSSDSEDDSEDSDDDRGRTIDGTPSGNKKRARSSLSTRREEERIRAAELAEKRRKKQVKLNPPSSISSGGISSGGGTRSSGLTSQGPREASSTDKCYRCGKSGHFSRDCPDKSTSQNRR